MKTTNLEILEILLQVKTLPEARFDAHSKPTMATTAKFWSKLSAAAANKIVPRIVSSGQGSHLTIGGRPYLNFCSSHYLGFAEEPRLKKAAQEAIELYGLGTGYRTLAGTHALHIELEEKIARPLNARARRAAHRDGANEPRRVGVGRHRAPRVACRRYRGVLSRRCV